MGSFSGSDIACGRVAFYEYNVHFLQELNMLAVQLYGSKFDICSQLLLENPLEGSLLWICLIRF